MQVREKRRGEGCSVECLQVVLARTQLHESAGAEVAVVCADIAELVPMGEVAQLSNQPNPFAISWFSYIPSHTRSSSHSRTGFSLGATSEETTASLDVCLHVCTSAAFPPKPFISFQIHPFRLYYPYAYIRLPPYCIPSSAPNPSSPHPHLYKRDVWRQ